MDFITNLYHFVIFAVCGSALIYDLLYVGDREEPYVYLFYYRGYGGKFKFLTFVCQVIQTVYFGLSVWNDISGGNVRPSQGKAKQGLQKFLDMFMASIVYPVGTFVVVTFWSIYMVDRELVFPKHLDAIIPPWLNHVMHTTVLPFLLVEKYLVYREYPNRRKGLSIMLGFALAYLIWILWIAYYANLWVYPILEVMEMHQRAIFIFVLLAFFCSIYIAGESLNKFLWRKELAHVPQRKMKKKK